MSEPTRDSDPFAREENRPDPLTREQKRMRTLVAVLLVGGLVAGLAFSTARQTTPSGGASSMGGMAMGGNQADMVGVTLRDIEGRELALPGGTPGAVMFMARRGCPACVEEAKSLTRAAADVSPAPSITLVGTDPVETRSDFRAFDRAAGGLEVRYALDDRSGSVAQQFGAGGAGTIVVYDGSGMILKRLRPGPRAYLAVERALHRR